MKEAALGIGMVDRAELIAAEDNLAQTMDQQLVMAGLVAIPRERFDIFRMAVTDILDGILRSDDIRTDVVAEQDRKITPTLFDDTPAGESESVDDIESATGSFEQDDNAPVGEGPVSISDSNKYGSIPLI